MGLTKLAILPCSCEVVTDSFILHYALVKLQYIWYSIDNKECLIWVAGKWKRHQYFKIEIWGGWVGQNNFDKKSKC